MSDDYLLTQAASGHRLTLRECVKSGNPIEAFNHFIMAWVDPKWHAHLLDNDENDAERVRQSIRDSATTDGRWCGHSHEEHEFDGCTCACPSGN